MEVSAPAQPSMARQAWTFVRHFLEMCVSMCAGGGLLAVLALSVIPGLLGAPDLRATFPEASLILLAILLTLPMAAWMRLRGMEWRPIAEMSAVPVGLALGLIAAVWLSVAQPSALAIKLGTFCGISCAGMFLVMLPRVGMYAGRAGHHMHHGAHPAMSRM